MDELRLFSTTLSPAVNIDLLVTNDKNQVLFTWRDDKYNGSGWHIPGSCIRFKESIADRIRKCAETELHTTVSFNPKVIAVVEYIINFERPIEDQNERAHFITLAYHCKVSSAFKPQDNMK